MKIGFAMTYVDGISGGRLHATLLAMELAAQGHEVTVVCNQAPSFLGKLPAVPGRDAVGFVNLKFDLLRPPNPLVFDLWVVVQERSLNSRFFFPVLENARRQRSPLVLLVFETPNWQEALLGASRNSEFDFVLSEVASLGCHCLCSSREGKKWAQAYFPGLPADVFHVLNPPILASYFPEPVERDKHLIVALTRRASPHKGHATILKLLDRQLAGRRVVLIDGYGISFEMRQFVRRTQEQHGLEIEMKAGITEAEKYRLLKSARLVLYPSSFEGFGLPPGEARYWGTPVLCYDLPVLREVYGDSLIYVPANDSVAMADALRAELCQEPDFSPSREALRVGDFGRWRNDVRAAFAAIRKRAAPPVALKGAASVPGWEVVMVDQLADWCKNDTAAAAGRPLDQCHVVSFPRNIVAQVQQDRIAQFLMAEETSMPPGDCSDDLRGKLLEVLTSISTPWVFLTQDLLVCPQEAVATAVAKGEEADVVGVAIPVRLHMQTDDLRHYRAVTGEMIAACGVFQREALLEFLRSTDLPGCRSQPVVDISYLVLCNGGQIAAATDGAENLPHRHLPVMYDLLPGGEGTWHQAYRKAQRIVDLLDPLPCRSADDDDELRRLIRFRGGLLDLLAESMIDAHDRANLRELLDFLMEFSPPWKRLIEGDRPLSPEQVGESYLVYGRAFQTVHHLKFFCRCLAVDRKS